MTFIGRLLLFVNVAFSLLVCGLIVVVYSTRSNWKAVADKNGNSARVAKAAYDAERSQRENDRKALNEQLAALEQGRLALEARIKRLDGQVAQLTSEQDLKDDNLTAANNTIKSQQTEVRNLKVEREQFVREKTEMQKRIDDLMVRVDKEQKDRVTAQINERVLNGRNDKLLTRNAELEQMNIALRQGGGTVATLPPGTLAAPSVPSGSTPPQDVYGTVSGVTDQGLAQVTLGTDHGLASGMTLIVYRADEKNPSASEYLGSLRLVRTEPKRSVGQFTPAKRNAKLKPGDAVAYVVGQSGGQ